MNASGDALANLGGHPAPRPPGDRHRHDRAVLVSGVLLCISAYRRERALGLRTCNICQYLLAALRESLPYRRLALSVVAR